MIINYDVSALLAQLANIDFAHVQNVTVSGTNLNTYTDGGIYYFSTSYEPANKPADAGTFGFLIVVRGSSVARTVQFWIDTSNTGNAVYFRSNPFAEVSWNSWKKIATGSIAAKTIAATIVGSDSLPEGITSVDNVTVVQSGNVVTVSIGLDRDATSITSWATIATGLPAPAVIPKSGNITIPFGEITVASTTWGRPLLCTVSSGGALQVRYGNSSGTYNGSFTYITNEY